MLRRGFSLALGAWERQSELVRRVHRILRRPSQSMTAKRATLVTATLVMAALAGTLSLARSPQLVSFAPPTQPTLQSIASTRPTFSNSNLNFSNVQTAPPSAHLVKAIMPVRPPQSLPVQSSPAHSENNARPLAVKAVKRTPRPRFAEQQQTFFVLTEWTDNGIPPHVVFAVAHDNLIRYAAVPVANGWLIVQI
jgi:hypothetical protein